MKQCIFIQKIRDLQWMGFFLLGAVVVFTMTPNRLNAEVIKSAISSDGVTFTLEPGFRTAATYVDPYILIAEKGDWVGLFSTSPAHLPQVIFVGTSIDGLSWSMESQPIITAPGGNALDPTAVPLDDGSYRVYYSATRGNDPFSGFFLKSGILSRKGIDIDDEAEDDRLAESNWTFTDDDINLGISGVSPEAILLDDGSVRLYVTGMGMKVYRAMDGLTFTAEASSLPPGSDPTLIRRANGTYRMYYVDMEQGRQMIWTAVSAGGLNWEKESSTGIGNPTGTQAWGVPDSIKLPDGRIRLYWVDM